MNSGDGASSILANSILAHLTSAFGGEQQQLLESLAALYRAIAHAITINIVRWEPLLSGRLDTPYPRGGKEPRRLRHTAVSCCRTGRMPARF